MIVIGVAVVTVIAAIVTAAAAVVGKQEVEPACCCTPGSMALPRWHDTCALGSVMERVLS